MAANREYSRVSALCVDGLGQVAVHLASSAEDTLHSCRGSRRSKVLLDHLAQVGPLGLLGLPPLQHLAVEVDQRSRHPRHRISENARYCLSSSCSTAGIVTGRRAAYIAKGAMRSAAENQHARRTENLVPPVSPSGRGSDHGATY